MTGADRYARIVERYHVKHGMGHCPAHEDKTPSLSVTLGGDRVLVHCHAGCLQSDVVDAMRRDRVWPESNGGGFHVGQHIEPVLSEARQEFAWWTPDQSDPVVQVRPGRNGHKYDWPTGTKPKRLIYPGPLPPGTMRVILCEGAKASLHAAGKSGLPALGIVSESILPDDDVLRAVGLPGREVWLWPDVGGEVVMNRLVGRLAALACDVKHVHPDVLGLRTKGDDAEQWQPGPDPRGELEAALRVAVAQPAAAEAPATGSMRLLLADDDDTEKPKPLVPGLVWEGCVSLITSAPKSGKTTLIADGLSRLFTGEAWLSERCEGDRMSPTSRESARANGALASSSTAETPHEARGPLPPRRAGGAGGSASRRILAAFLPPIRRRPGGSAGGLR